MPYCSLNIHTVSKISNCSLEGWTLIILLRKAHNIKEELISSDADLSCMRLFDLSFEDKGFVGAYLPPTYHGYLC
jgi:hypothetical protein